MSEDSSDNGIAVIRWTGDSLCLLDQRRLPVREEYLTLESVEGVADAISRMVVRGAPAIGIAAAYGMVISANAQYADSPANWQTKVFRDGLQLIAARPTAVNLRWAVDRMVDRAKLIAGDPFPILLAEAKAIHAEDKAACRAMGSHGMKQIPPGSSVLTYCNTGALATGGIGTALGVVRMAWTAGNLKKIYASETRPWLQGARLTAWELARANIPVQLITDNAAAFLMQKQCVQWVVVGADRVTANGDVINKIGSYNLAVLCRYHGVGFMVVAPVSSFDLALQDGSSVPIEERDPTEILVSSQGDMAVPGVGFWSPAFDVTPAELVTCLVTENGVIEAPDQQKIAALVRI